MCNTLSEGVHLLLQQVLLLLPQHCLELPLMPLLHDQSRRLGDLELPVSFHALSTPSLNCHVTLAHLMLDVFISCLADSVH